MSERGLYSSKTDIARRLPVRLDKRKELDEKCPRYMDLLQRVSQKLDPSGRSLATQRNLEARKENTDVARKKYLEANIRVETLNEVILKSELNSLTLPGASHETALVNKLRENLTMAEVSCMLDLGEIGGEPVTTLGLDKRDSRLVPWTSQHGLESHQFCRQLLPLVEDHLFSKCHSLLLLLDQGSELENQPMRVLHPRIVRIPDRIADLESSLAREQGELEELAMEWEGVVRDQMNMLGSVLDLLDRLITTHYAGSKARTNSTTVNYLAAKTEALQLKLRCLELEILNSTYTKDSVAAVRKVGRRLEERMATYQEEMASLKSRLAQYHAAGSEFNQVVLEFARLQKEIEGKRWALDRLGGSKGGGGGNSGPAAL